MKKVVLVAITLAFLGSVNAGAQEPEEKADEKIQALSIPVHQRPPYSGTWNIPNISTSGSCNGSGTNVQIRQSQKSMNVVMCRISKWPGGEKREFINKTIPGGEGYFTVGCSKDGSAIYGYEVHWWDPDPNYFPNPITEGSAALTRYSHVLENGNQFKSVVVEVAAPNGKWQTLDIKPKSAEPVPASWSIMNAWYKWPYEATKCDDGRG